jgi:hypothetical protein
VISAVVWINFAATLYLLGLIWCIQIVHYPLMNRVDSDRFREFHGQHGLRITLVVVAPMLVELASAAALAVWVPEGVESVLPVVGLILVVVIWISTFAIQVPLHRRLAHGFDSVAHRRLVNSNWLRTVAWSLRAVVVFVIAVQFSAV